MTDLVRRRIRTFIPAIWGAAVAYLVAIGILPEASSAEVQASLIAGTTPIAVGAWHWLVSWAEPYLPGWLRSIVIGPTKHNYA